MKKTNPAECLRQEIATGKDPHRVWEEFLDYCLQIFDVSHYLTEDGFTDNAQAKAAENANYYSAMTMVLEQIADAIDSGSAIDPLGRIYEELFQSKGKASQLGQFFTPESVCELMARTASAVDGGSVYDCACGSGRTLIAHRIEEMKCGRIYPAEYVGEDIDIVSVKMCALNLMWYGCRGHVAHADTLRMEYYGTVYHINEVRYPFFTANYSVRKVRISKQQPKHEPQPVPVKTAPVQLELF